MRRAFCAAALALCLLLAALPGRARAEAAEYPRPAYTFAITLLSDRQALYVEQHVRCTNDTGIAQKDVYFQLPANALRRLSTAPFLAEDLDKAYPEGFAPGGIEFVRVQAGGADCDWGVQGEAETVLRLGMPEPLAPGEEAEFTFVYYVLLPRDAGELGADKLCWRLCGFYPALCVYDQSLEAWSVAKVSPLGSTLLTAAADYEARVRLPAGWKLAASGLQEIEESGAEGVTWTVRAENAREFALCAGPSFSVSTRVTASGVTLRALTVTPLCAGAILDAAEQALQAYAEWFGEYPFAELDLAESGILSGRTGSGVVLLPSGITGLTKRAELRYEVARLAARQWFSGLVGVDAAREPWLRDTLSEYAALLLVERREGRRAYLRRLNQLVVPALKITIPGGLTVDSALDRFDSAMEYDTVVICRGLAVMHELREMMGAEAFESAMALFVSENAGGIATVADLAGALDRSTGSRWDEYLVGQLQTISDYAGQDVKPYD